MLIAITLEHQACLHQQHCPLLCHLKPNIMPERFVVDCPRVPVAVLIDFLSRLHANLISYGHRGLADADLIVRHMVSLLVVDVF